MHPILTAVVLCSQPVYLRVRLAAQKGTNRSCSCSDRPPPPAPSSLSLSHEHDGPIPSVTIQSPAHSPHASTPYRCPYASPPFCSILAECVRFNRKHSPAATPHPTDVVAAARAPLQHTKPSSSSIFAVARPIINVIDADNEPICMCSLYASTDNVRQLDETVAASVAATAAGVGCPLATLCSVCSNTIRQQATEPRRTLVTKRLQLANDIIVNRVDTHYLHLGGYATDRLRVRHDPYTPESVESHSPMGLAGDSAGCGGLSEAELDDDDDVDDAEKSAVARPPNGRTLGGKSALPLRDEINRNTMGLAAAAADVGVNGLLPLVTTTTAVALDSTPTAVRGVSPGALKSRLEDLRLVAERTGEEGGGADGAGCATDGGGKKPSARALCCRNRCQIQ